MTNGDPRREDAVAKGKAAAVAGRYPATANQAACWREARSAADSAAFNIAFRRRVEGRMSDGAVESALRVLIARHEILRTRFCEASDGKVIQEVLDHIAFRPAQVDLRHLRAPLRDEELGRLGSGAALEPFLVDSGSTEPLMRVLLVRMSADVAYLHFVFHELIIDGWSIELLVDEFCKLVVAHDASQSLDQPATDMQFGDFALWQTDMLEGTAFDADRDYWRSKLNGLPNFAVRPDREASGEGPDSQIKSIQLPKSLTDAFENRARELNHTLASLATAAAAVALHLVTGAPEVVLGTQVAGREDPDSQTIVGPLLNTVLLRLPAARSDRFDIFAARVRDTLYEVLEHQHLPFAEVAKLMASPAGGAGIAHYGVNIVVQRTNISSSTVEAKDFGPFRIVSAPGHSVAARVPLSLFMVGRGDGWRLSCEGMTRHYTAATLDMLLSLWRQVMEAVIVNPGAELGSLTKPDPAQHSAIIATARPANPRIEALRKRITVLQPDGNGAAIMALNNNSVLYPVASAIGKRNPFFDIQFCPSERRTTLPQRHFVDHARDAVEMIRLARPHGPYVLFGLCVFGAVAIEAARLLEEEGEEVALVVLNDTYRPGYRERMGPLDRHVRKVQVVWRTFKTLRERYRAGEITAAEWIDNYRLARTLRLRPVLQRAGLIADFAAHDVMQDHNRWFPEEVLLPSQAQFDMLPYTGPVVLFRNTAMREGRLFPRDFGWQGYAAGKFMVVDCPGTHDTMFRAAGAAVIGKIVQRVLAEPAAETGGGG